MSNERKSKKINRKKHTSLHQATSQEVEILTRTVSKKPHSIILVSCKPGCKLGFRPGLQPGFRQVRAGLRHAFDMLLTRFRLFCRKPGREPAASI